MVHCNRAGSLPPLVPSPACTSCGGGAELPCAFAHAVDLRGLLLDGVHEYALVHMPLRGLHPEARTQRLAPCADGPHASFCILGVGSSNSFLFCVTMSQGASLSMFIRFTKKGFSQEVRLLAMVQA